jgi:hypothetical protein
LRTITEVRVGQWTRLLKKSFGNIAENVWTARNGVVHGKDKRGSLAIKKASLVPEIERAFAIHPTSLRAVDRIILTGNLKVAMLQTTYQNQLAWLGSVRSAMFAAAFAGSKLQRRTDPTNLAIYSWKMEERFTRSIEAPLYHQQQPSNRSYQYWPPQV